MHWFDDPDEYFRADLLRLRSQIVDGYFVVDAQVVECKLANVADNFLVHARQQMESALRQLISHFRPRRGNQPLGTGKLGEDDPEARYWWMQLHRLLASKGTVPQANYATTLAALERLSDGYFTINWQGAAVAFWRDKPGVDWNCGPQWAFQFDDRDMNLYVGEAGASFIPSFCSGASSGAIFTEDDNLISYTYKAEDDAPGEQVSTTKRSSQEADDFGSEKEYDEPNGETGQVVDEGSRAINDTGNLPQGPTPEERPSDPPHVTAIQVKPRIPERILLGSRVSTQQKVYWEFGHQDLPNRHILVFGSSGSGKTYTIQALLCELGKFGQNSIIVDYTNGFTKNQLENTVIQKLRPVQHVVRNNPLKINPFRKQSYIIDDLEFYDKATNVAERVKGVFSSVYNLGDQQKAALYEAITTGVNTLGDSFTLERLVDGLESLQSGGGPNAGPATTVLNKIRPFVEMEPFEAEGQQSWEQMFTDQQNRCHIIQLAGFMKDTSRLITEFSLLDLYWYYRSKGNKDIPRVVVLDEIQNLDHKLEGPLGQILTEGRKFGINLILATQTLSNLERDERDRLFQASHKLFFKPADTEINTYARILSDATGERQEEWVAKLTALKRGECYSLGPALNERTGNLEVNKYFKVRIDAIDNRFNEGVGHAAN
jgi:DNA phosphorothioation-dependent restriction protein DptH